MKSRVKIPGIVLVSIVVSIYIMSIPGLAESSKVVAISAGQQYTLVLYDNGTVWGWGDNGNYVLGSSTMTRSYVPIQVPIYNVKAISAAPDFVLALLSDGTVWGWGFNNAGNLGYETFEKQPVPVQIKGLDHVKAISAGGRHCLALKEDGTVWTWGSGDFGQLGTGVISPKNEEGVPVHRVNIHVPDRVNISDVKAISAGALFSAALKEDGTVWTWGQGLDGALGNSKHEDEPRPVQALISNVTMISACNEYFGNVLVIKDDGTLWGWGNNLRYQLLDGSGGDTANPVKIGNFKKVTAIATGVTSYAVDEDNQVWGWGSGDNGKLGSIDYSGSHPNNPLKIYGLEGTIAIAAGLDHLVALKKDSSVWTWGRCDYGQLGVGIINYAFSQCPIPQKAIIGSLDNQQSIINIDQQKTIISVSQDPEPNPEAQTIITPGMSFNTIISLCCLLITVGLLSGFLRRKG